MITIIAAAGENNELGLKNGLVWHLPDDFRRFKELTTGHHIIMGRKTFESFPKPLPNRTHIVITRQDYSAEGIIVVHSLAEAISEVKNDPEPYIIGGGEIYSMSMKIADKIELTRIHGTFEADTFFPEIPEQEWQLIETQYHPVDSRHDHAFTFETWIRKQA